MSWAAVAAGGAAIGGALIQGDAASSASKKANKGSKAQLAYARESRDMARADTRHVRQASATALNALMSMTGLSGAANATAINPETGYPYESSGGVLGPVEAVDGAPVVPDSPVVAEGGRRSSFIPRYGGGTIYRDTVYNVNEVGPENVYSGGDISRGKGPSTIDGETGYVEPNVEGRFLGGLVGGAALGSALLGGGGNKGTKKRGVLPGTDWIRNDRGKVMKTGYGHWNNDLGAYVDRRGRVKKNQAPPPEGYVPPSQQTDIDTTLGTDYQFQTDPGYQFRFEEGMRALDRGAAARGGLLSGGYGRRAIRYGQDYASNEYSNVYNRIANIAGLGQVANSSAANAALYGGAAMGRAAADSGINSAYGAIGRGNAAANAINQLGQVDWGSIFGGRS